MEEKIQEVTKVCSKCGVSKSIDEFNKNKSRKDGYEVYCRICESVRRHNRYVKNKEKELIKAKIYYTNTKPERQITNQKWRSLHKEYISNYHKTHYQLHSKEKYEYKKNRLKNDKMFKLKENIRSRMYMALKCVFKSGSTVTLLGCDISEYKIYLEQQFKDNMTWENQGKLWHIDHIIPIKFFNLNDITEQKLAFNYSNTQPLYSIDNRIKNCTLPHTNFNNPTPFI